MRVWTEISSGVVVRRKTTGDGSRGVAWRSFRRQSVQAAKVSFYLRNAQKGPLPAGRSREQGESHFRCADSKKAHSLLHSLNMPDHPSLDVYKDFGLKPWRSAAPCVLRDLSPCFQHRLPVAAFPIGCPRLRGRGVIARFELGHQREAATSSSVLAMARPMRSRLATSMVVPRQKVPRATSSQYPLFRPCGRRRSAGRPVVHA